MHMTVTEGCPVQHDFDPLGESYQRDPYEILAGCRPSRSSTRPASTTTW